MTGDGSQSFSASYDLTTKIISAAVFLILAVPVVATKSVVIGALGAAVLAISFAYSPRGYEIWGRSIVVRRLMGNVSVPLDEVRELRKATAEDFRGCIRLWGNGGLFGYYGLFRTATLGKCTWYVTNRRNVVVLVTGAKTVLFSPDDVEGFLAAVRAMAPVAGTAAGPLAAIEPRGFGFAWIGGGLVAILALGIAGFAILYSPGPPKLTLTSGSLAIHDRFYPVRLGASSVDVARVRVVDMAVDKEWRPTSRTNGFANAHYRSGWFRVANGQKVRLYDAGGKRLVLLPPSGDGAAVLVEVPEPEGFVEEVQRAWSGRAPAARMADR